MSDILTAAEMREWAGYEELSMYPLPPESRMGIAKRVATLRYCADLIERLGSASFDHALVGIGTLIAKGVVSPDRGRDLILAAIRGDE